MNRSMIDLWVGVFVVVGFAALIFLALKVGNLASFSTDDTYQVQAKFANIGGLKVRGPVKSAGVVVGRVADIRFDNESALLIETMGAERFVFGTGMPLRIPETSLAKLDLLDLSEEERARIESENVREFSR